MWRERFKAFLIRSALSGVIAAVTYIGANASNVVDPTAATAVAAGATYVIHFLHAMWVKNGGEDVPAG